MCLIVGSFDLFKLAELTQQNLDRGAIAHSFAMFSPNGSLQWLKKGEGPFEAHKISVDIQDGGCYFLVHQQAPTAEGQEEYVYNPKFVHPAEFDNSILEEKNIDLLWHNGMILGPDLDKLVEMFSIKDERIWDTDILLRYISANGIPPAVNGSYACVHYSAGEGAVKVFRNKRAPLFIDKKLTISSTRFKGSKEIDPGIIFQLDFMNKKLLDTGVGFDGGIPHFVDITSDFANAEVDPLLLELLGTAPVVGPKELTEEVRKKVLPADAGIKEVTQNNEYYFKVLENIQYKYQEEKHLAALKQYIDATYQNHYGKHGVQAIELILASGLGKGFFLGNVIKYAQRYGSKNGENKDDLLKVLHYALLMLEDHEIRNGK